MYTVFVLKGNWKLTRTIMLYFVKHKRSRHSYGTTWRKHYESDRLSHSRDASAESRHRDLTHTHIHTHTHEHNPCTHTHAPPARLGHDYDLKQDGVVFEILHTIARTMSSQKEERSFIESDHENTRTHPCKCCGWGSSGIAHPILAESIDGRVLLNL